MFDQNLNDKQKFLHLCLFDLAALLHYFISVTRHCLKYNIGGILPQYCVNTPKEAWLSLHQK